MTHQNTFYLNALSEGYIFTDGLANNERAFVNVFVFDLLMNIAHESEITEHSFIS
jgi:hypothetical protein